MSESIVQVVQGSQLDDPSKYSCGFCQNVTPAVQVFGVTVKKNYKGVMIKHFGVCEQHLLRLNALLSGEFDIDQIFLERFKSKARKTLRVRGHPTLRIAETKNAKTLKECAFGGCTNRFYGIATRKYCSDERCKEMRKLAAASKPRRRTRDPDADNLILPKSLSSWISKGKVLTLRCRAKDGDGCRCRNTFTTVYEPQCTVYPKYCQEHRTGYRRRRFSLLRKGHNA